jgi:hypothetical protein
MKTNDDKQHRRRLLQAGGGAIASLALCGLAFDAGTPIFGRALTAAEVRRELGIKS